MKVKLHKIERGTCPYCGGADIEYGSSDYDDEMVRYSATCNNCKRRFDEWYNLTFVGHNVGDHLDIVLNDGDENVEIEISDEV